MIEAGRDLSHRLVFGSEPLKVFCPQLPRFQGLLSLTRMFEPVANAPRSMAGS